MSKLAAISDEYIFDVANAPGGAAPTNVNTFSDILGIVFNVAMGVGFGITLLGLGYAAIQYILSQGDPKKLIVAKDSLIWSAMGMFIVLGSWAFKNIVLKALGVTGSEFIDAPTF